jgi:hypothetical protein
MGSQSTWGRGVRGEARIATIIWVVIFLVVVFAVIRFVPVKIKNTEMADYTEQEAKSVALARWTCEKASERIVTRAKELKIPLEDKGVKCEMLTSTVRIEVDYTAPVNFLVYTWQWEVAIEKETPKINV